MGPHPPLSAPFVPRDAFLLSLLQGECPHLCFPSVKPAFRKGRDILRCTELSRHKFLHFLAAILSVVRLALHFELQASLKNYAVSTTMTKLPLLVLNPSHGSSLALGLAFPPLFVPVLPLNLMTTSVTSLALPGYCPCPLVLPLDVSG